MQHPTVIIGLGEMGGIFARAFLCAGIPVIPVIRNSDIQQIAHHYPYPRLVVLAVAEKDLHISLDTLPKQWRGSLVLLQNELLPRDWQVHHLDQPTVISVWVEKKRGQDYKVIIPSPIFGPAAKEISQALATLDIPTIELSNTQQLTTQLVLKNLYILTTNIAGLICGGTVKDLWQSHQTLALAVAADIIDIQDALTEAVNDRAALLDGMIAAFAGDWTHPCVGRSAAQRLNNSLILADQFNLAVPKLREITQRAHCKK